MTRYRGNVEVGKLLALDTKGTAGTGVFAQEFGTRHNRSTVLTINAVNSLTLGDNAALGDGHLIYTFPAGAMIVDWVYSSVALTAGSAQLQADTPDVGIGTVVASGVVSVLGGTATFENLANGSAAADTNGTATLTSALPTASASFVIATGDAHTVYYNAAATWSDDTTPDLTCDISGTVVLHWRFMA